LTDDIERTLRQELGRTEPDYVVYVPRSLDGSTNDSHNEHFLVFDGPDGSLMAVWTQAWHLPDQGNINHIVFSASEDEGVTWSRPTWVAGPRDRDDPTHMASWAFPMVSRSGRIYVVWNQNKDLKGWILFHTGTMAGCYSDDYGRTWSEPQDIPMPDSPYDDPEGKIPPEWIVWQRPMRDLAGGYFVGYSHWINRAVATLKEVESWPQIESVVEFMRFANVDDGPEPRELRIHYSAWGEEALRVPHYRYPLLSVTQEPSLVRLPDDRLFCAMRTNSGYIWYSLSEDDGETWCNPRPLLRRDHGRPLLHPVSCAPIYALSDGRYVLFHHNHRGDADRRPEATHGPRRPVYLVTGEYRPHAEQPIWFSDSKLFMDTDGVGFDGTRGTNSDLSLYASFTTRGGNDILWYPDRKFFLLGKRIRPEFLVDMHVPGTQP
jgi:hypothetical protein